MATITLTNLTDTIVSVPLPFSISLPPRRSITTDKYSPAELETSESFMAGLGRLYSVEQTINLENFPVAALQGTTVVSTHFPAIPLFEVGAEAGNVVPVTIQFVNVQLQPITLPFGFIWYLSDSGDFPGPNALIAVAPDGGVAATTGVIPFETVAGKAGYAVTNGTGKVVFEITHAAGAKTLFLVVQCLLDVFASSAVSFT